MQLKLANVLQCVIMKKLTLLCLFFTNLTFFTHYYPLKIKNEVILEQTLPYKFCYLRIENLKFDCCDILKGVPFEKTDFIDIGTKNIGFKVITPDKEALIDEFFETGYCCMGNLRSVQIIGKTINNALLKGVDLYKADLSKSNFLEGDFVRCNFTRSVATNSSFCGANMIEADMTEANFEGADFTGACLLGTRMVRTMLRNAKFDNADLRKTIFYKADLTGTNFVGADLRNADMRFTKLRGSNFTSANLANADFTGADVSDANFVDTYIKKTVWNDGRVYNTITFNSLNLHGK